VISAEGREAGGSTLPQDAIAANGGQRNYSRGEGILRILPVSANLQARVVKQTHDSLPMEKPYPWTAHTPSAEGIQSGGTGIAKRVRRLSRKLQGKVDVHHISVTGATRSRQQEESGLESSLKPTMCHATAYRACVAPILFRDGYFRFCDTPAFPVALKMD
jgi:hypothetical protein